MKQFNFKLSALFLSGALFISLGCGKKKEEEANTSTGAHLIGTWNGTITTRQSGTTEVSKATVAAKFYESKDYEITDVALAKTAKGKYYIFEEEKHLNLVITESSFPEFGLVADPKDYAYQISADGLILRETNTTIFLVKDGSRAEKPKGSTMVGNWQCADDKDSEWKLSVAEKDVKIAITGVGVTTKIQGSLSEGDPDEAENLKVRKMTVSKMFPVQSLESINMEFDFRENPPKLTLAPLTTQGQTLPFIPCVRPE